MILILIETCKESSVVICLTRAFILASIWSLMGRLSLFCVCLFVCVCGFYFFVKVRTCILSWLLEFSFLHVYSLFFPQGYIHGSRYLSGCVLSVLIFMASKAENISFICLTNWMILLLWWAFTLPMRMPYV